MVEAGIDRSGSRITRPRRQLVNRAIFAGLCLLLPLTVLAYWLSIPRNTWLYVLAMQVVLTTLGLVVTWSARRMYVSVDSSGVEIRRLLGRVTRIPAGDIAGIVLAEIYQSDVLETLPHLYLLNSSGEVLLRLRGQIWPASGLESIIFQLDVPVIRPPDPLTLADLGRLQPQLVRRCTRRAARLGVEPIQ